MSFELNKLFCAILFAILVYLLASFTSELIFHSDQDKSIKLSFYIDEPEDKETLIKSEENNKNIIITEAELNTILSKASYENGETFIKKNCASCHEFNLPIKNKIGPSLAKVFNREIGSLNDYKYSKTLKKMSEKWTILNLYFFLEKPKIWAEGTKMSYRGISNRDNLYNTIKYLKQNSINNEN